MTMGSLCAIFCSTLRPALVSCLDADQFMVNFLRLILLREYRDVTGWSTLVIHWQEV